MNGVTVVAVGDLQLGDSPTCVGFGFGSRYAATDLDGVFAQVRPTLAAGDVVFGNLESTLSSLGLQARQWRSMQLRGEAAYAAGLRRAGFSVLNVANNHATQHGEATFHDTVRLLETVGIRCCGLKGSAPWSSQPLRLGKSAGQRVGILAYSLRPRQYGEAQTPYAEGDPAAMQADVRRLAGEVDYVLVSLHWGREFVALPSQSEVDLAHSLVDAGAVLILGHHPHVLRPVERSGRAAIAYSLGNFVADMIWQPVLRAGALLRCRLEDTGVTQVELLRTLIDNAYRPTIVGRDDGQAQVETPLRGLDEESYSVQERRTVQAQRRASYRYAAGHLLHYPPGMLAQLAGRTIRNKLVGLVRRRADGDYY
jgi:poly-gamma-glutamate synthesis protein (capsule biosynthesis protein)